MGASIFQATILWTHLKVKKLVTNMFRITLILATVALTLLAFVEDSRADDTALPEERGGHGATCRTKAQCRRPLKCYDGTCYECVGNYGCPGSKECHSNRCIGGDH